MKFDGIDQFVSDFEGAPCRAPVGVSFVDSDVSLRR